MTLRLASNTTSMLAEAGVLVVGLDFAGLSPGARSGVLIAPYVAVAPPPPAALGPTSGTELAVWG